MRIFGGKTVKIVYKFLNCIQRKFLR